MQCAVCSDPIARGETTPYQFGPVVGELCPECGVSLEEFLTRWMAKRCREAATEQVRRERQRAAEDRLCQREADAQLKLRRALFPDPTTPRARRAEAAE